MRKVFISVTNITTILLQRNQMLSRAQRYIFQMRLEMKVLFSNQINTTIETIFFSFTKSYVKCIVISRIPFQM